MSQVGLSSIFHACGDLQGERPKPVDFPTFSSTAMEIPGACGGIAFAP